MGKKKKTHEEFVSEVITKVGDKFEFLTKYVGADYRIRIRCKEDGYEWNPIAHAFLNNNCKCPKCSNCVQTKDTNYFKKEIYEKFGDEYVVIGEYINCKQKILMKHNKEGCNREFYATPDSLLSKGNGCPVCRHREGADKLFLTQEEFENRVYMLFKDEYTVLGKYKGGKERVLIRHNKCNREYLQQAGDILQGKGCRYCYGTLKKTQEKFEEEIFNLYNGEYTVLGEYVNSKTPVLIKHNKCGNEKEFSPNSILNNHGCTCESISKGECQIKNFLEFNKINYVYQYKNKLCKFKTQLPFDFAILDTNKKIICLIEYDGEQHFRPVKFGGISDDKAKENFLETQKRDNIKNEYCKKNNILLFRIPYFNIDNINNILLDLLKPNFKNVIIPNEDILKNKWSETKLIQLVNLLSTLPNGIYPKTWIKEKTNIDQDGWELSRILKKDIAKNFINNNNITISSESFIIINNYTDYNEYLNLISNYNNHNKHTIIKIIRMLENLPCGIHKKGDILELREINCNGRISSTYLQNAFLKKYMEDNDITIENKFIIKTTNKGE